MATPEPEKKGGFRVPEFVTEWLMKMVPYALIGIIGAGIGLFIDNIGNKKDIARNDWRNNQQDVRHDRSEMRDDRQDDAIAELRDTQNEFQSEALHRLDILLEKQERRRRREQ